jgi:hypothetical protein
MAIKDTTAGRWFRRVLWLGIAANMALSVPTLLVPERMLALTSLPITAPIMWTRFAGLLLILLSVFYMPAAVDPDRHRSVAWLAVGSRLAGVVFFIGTQAPEYRMFGWFDFVFFVPEAALLLIAARGEAA